MRFLKPEEIPAKPVRSCSRKRCGTGYLLFRISLFLPAPDVRRHPVAIYFPRSRKHIVMDSSAAGEKKPKYMTGIDAAVSIISGKWKALILYQLEGGTLRYSQILNGMEYGITQRMLTKELREMEESGLISRTVYPEVPPKVEYTITAKGRSLMPILDQLCAWGCQNMADQLEHNCEAGCEGTTE